MAPFTLSAAPLTCSLSMALSFFQSMRANNNARADSKFPIEANKLLRRICDLRVVPDPAFARISAPWRRERRHQGTRRTYWYVRPRSTIRRAIRRPCHAVLAIARTKYDDKK